MHGAAVRNALENSAQLLHEQQARLWPHRPSGAPCGDSINSFKLLQTFPTLSTYFMCRVQQGTVSCSSTTCRLHSGRFASPCQRRLQRISAPCLGHTAPCVPRGCPSTAGSTEVMQQGSSSAAFPTRLHFAACSSCCPQPSPPSPHRLLVGRQGTATAVNDDIKISIRLIIGFVCVLQPDAPLSVEPVLQIRRHVRGISDPQALSCILIFQVYP